MTGMEGMTATTDVTDMVGMTSVAASSTFHTALATATNTPTLPASAASDTTLSDEADVSSSAAIMNSMDSMPSMSNAFHFGVGDSLWATPLTPTTGQGYAGAIMLLILMALFLRFLTTARGMVEKRWNPKRSSHCNGHEGDNYLKMGQSREDEAGVDSSHRWNITIQLTRALFQVTTMTVGYLLMLAVMTFNVGYLLAVLTGGFLGELALGWVS
ncbi:hypothetical protein FOWG_17276 [Fusarium oxysporum f. sp. lycopersici MN25]|nr:hypothetical protein FOWG_17276 [Fusarium oxysporum f. sp. lycopersici MN25]